MHLPRPAALLALVLASALGGGPLHAPTAKGKPGAPSASADVEATEQLYAKLDYDGAKAFAERITKRSGLSHEQMLRAYRVLAVTTAILDDPEGAREAFLQVLVLDPDYSVDANLGP